MEIGSFLEAQTNWNFVFGFFGSLVIIGILIMLAIKFLRITKKNARFTATLKRVKQASK